MFVHTFIEVLHKLKKIIPPAIKYGLKSGSIRLVNSLVRKRPRIPFAGKVDTDGVDCVLACNEYGAYCVPRSSIHRPAAQKIMAGKVHEAETLQFMKEHCGNGDIVHAGTYYGDFLPFLSKAVSENAMIWAFEPHPENFKCAEITILINDITKVNLHRLALGGSDGSTEMIIRSNMGVHLGGGSKIPQDEMQGLKVPIKLVRLDDLLPQERKISIIQLDVEGYELEALKGAVGTIQKWKPILILEDDKNAVSTEWFKEHILALGYRQTGDIEGNKVFEGVG